jgi:hypothetical protein
MLHAIAHNASITASAPKCSMSMPKPYDINGTRMSNAKISNRMA